MGRMTRVVAYSVVAGASMFGVGEVIDRYMTPDIGISKGAQLGWGGEYVGDYDEAVQLVAEAEDDVEGARQELRQVESSLGEACVGLARAYMDYDGYNSVTEETRIQEMLDEPGQPCGGTARDIRTAYGTLEDANDQLYWAEADLTDREDAPEQLLKSARDDDNFNAGLVLGLGGAGLGALVGAATGTSGTSRRRERRDSDSPESQLPGYKLVK